MVYIYTYIQTYLHYTVISKCNFLGPLLDPLLENTWQEHDNTSARGLKFRMA